MTTLRDAVDNVRNAAWYKAKEIRQDVWANRVVYRDPGSLAWALDDVRLRWADFLVALSGWAQ